MKNLKLFFLLSLLSFSINAQHTFSIVAVDPDTGEIGSAGATCLDFEDGALAISDIVLGIGAIHTQSFYSPTNQNNARTRMVAGDSPQQIIDWLIANDVSNDPSARQYNIVDLNNGSPRSAAFTGPDCFEEFIHITGPNYAIAGNILISEDVVTDMETAFLDEPGSLSDKLMAALQGAKRPGADARCLNDGISSASAFLRVADPSDTDSSYGNLSLDLNVWLNGSVFEPIDELQSQYDDATTLSISENSISENSILIFPNPASDRVTIKGANNTTFDSYILRDITGKVVQKNSINSPQNRLLIDLGSRAPGVYFITIRRGDKKLKTKKVIVKR